MTDSGSGNYTLPPGYLAVAGQTILASQHNPPLEDIAAALNRRSFRDGRAPMIGNQSYNGYRVTDAGDAIAPQDYVTLAQVQELIAAVASVPTGALLPLTGSVVPDGWAVANGQSLLRADYPAFWIWVQASGNLAATEGAKTHGQYGPGDGSTTFTLPNLYADNGYFIRPISSGRGIGTIQADELKAHTHTGTAKTAGKHRHTTTSRAFANGSTDVSGILLRAQSASVGNENTQTTENGDHDHELEIAPTIGTETRPKNIAYPVLIKT